MRDPDENGWSRSAGAWIARMPEEGDFVRAFVLDRPMRTLASGARRMLDIGCGEGRFCRMMARDGVAATGLDPVPAMLAQARRRDPRGRYVEGFAEDLPFEDGSFDLVAFYMSLIDIDDHRSAIAEAARVLAPGGYVLIGNLASFATSNGLIGSVRDRDGRQHFPLGHYLDARADWVEWDDIRVRNWHRPLEAYMEPLLAQGLRLVDFAEPEPHGGPPERVARYRATPYAMLMRWRKDGG